MVTLGQFWRSPEPREAISHKILSLIWKGYKPQCFGYKLPIWCLTEEKISVPYTAHFSCCTWGIHLLKSLYLLYLATTNNNYKNIRKDKTFSIMDWISCFKHLPLAHGLLKVTKILTTVSCTTKFLSTRKLMNP